MGMLGPASIPVRYEALTRYIRYILTNRHVVGAGPFWGHALFDKHQEVDVYAVYRDPVHDFGILRFDPEAVKCTELNALVLRPDLARG